MRRYYRGEKLLLTFLLVVGLSVLLGGCVGIKDRFVSSEATGRLAPLSDQINVDPPPGGNNGLLIACGLKEIPPKEAGIDPEAFWQDSQIAALQDALEAHGLKLTFGAMRAFSSESVRLGFVPFRAEDGMVRAGIAFEERSGQLSAVALVQQAGGTLNIHPNGREELWALVSQQTVQGLIEQLRRDEVFQAFERELASQGKQINAGQSLGATTADKGLLYLAVVESSSLTLNLTVVYYRIELSAVEKGYQMQGAPQELCLSSKDENKVLGSPDGALMRLIGVYGIGSEDKLELQVVRLPKDPCLLGLGTLACLDTQRWLVQVLEERKQKLLEIINIAAKDQGLFNVTYFEDMREACGLLFAGFDDLSLERMRELYGLCEAGLNSEPNPNFEKRLTQVKQALELLQSIEPDRIREWLSMLQRILMEEGEDRFYQEYGRLLSQEEDFVKLVAAILIMSDEVPVSVQADQVIEEIIIGILKQVGAQVIWGLLTPPPSPKDPYVWLFQWNLKKEYEQRVGGRKDDAIWQRFEELWDRFVLTFSSPHKEALTVAIYIIAQNMIQNLALPPLLPRPWPVGVNAHVNAGLNSFANFLQWALTQGDPGMPPVDRREQAMGTLYALSMFALGGGWHMHGFLVGGFDPVPQSWAAGLAFLPAVDKSGKFVIPGFEKNIVLVLRGDHCKDCGNPDKVKKIIEWVNQAITVVSSRWFGQMYPENRNERIIALVFTNENATGIPTVISELKKKFDEKDVAIVVIYFDKQSDGTYTIKLSCIGKKCSELEEAGVLDKIKSDYARALQAAMRAYPGYSPEEAWWLAYGVCGGDLDCINFLREQLEKEQGGGGANCQGTKLYPLLRQKALAPC